MYYNKFLGKVVLNALDDYLLSALVVSYIIKKVKRR